jgi:hypothetical protein
LRGKAAERGESSDEEQIWQPAEEKAEAAVKISGNEPGSLACSQLSAGCHLRLSGSGIAFLEQLRRQSFNVFAEELRLD